ncbi:hypothetical protein Fluta_0309 [Fluviicola taffensis DSM 16823]|uniref:Uncharacterized protein n=1 Tax=Fluviicola taffensis (strain DSM 16823 / NCIMB 13979 / RW262) TaxID=755732 RepID=F2IDE2_FLUTR|nr:hypothetical protein Fluta_0309 [Fluviicola taffensis DSM 16823]
MHNKLWGWDVKNKLWGRDAKKTVGTRCVASLLQFFLPTNFIFWEQPKKY